MAVQTTKKDSEYIANDINNVQSDAIRITEDKLRLKLTSFLKDAKQSHDWIGVLGIIVSIFLSLTTAEFHDAYRLSADTWRNLFSIVLFGLIFLFIYKAYKAIFCRITVDKMVEKLKQP